VRVGVLALQGAVREHVMMLEALDVACVPVRKPHQLAELSGLIIPGGESTAIGKLMETAGFYEPIREQHEVGMAVWGTCAGAILIADEILDEAAGQRSLGLMDVSVRRNAFGRQVDSFEADLEIAELPGGTFRGIFIRAPWIERVGESCRQLASHDGHVVAAQQGDLLATVFHPELTGDPRMHRFFIENVIGVPRR
jgi:5'-phosphate synthase pdxT subunit